MHCRNAYSIVYDVTIGVSLWFISKDKDDRKDKVLFIDARKMGYMETEGMRIKTWGSWKIYSTYHSWKKDENYQDIEGFQIHHFRRNKKNDYVLTPIRYVGTRNQKTTVLNFKKNLLSQLMNY